MSPFTSDREQRLWFWALAVTAAHLMALTRTLSWEERTHLFEYGPLAVLIHQALAERLRHGRRVPGPQLGIKVARAGCSRRLSNH